MNARQIRFKRGPGGLYPEVQPAEPLRPRAVALGYDPEQDSAPRVLAAGQGVLAEQIIALARQNGIPIREDPILAAALASVDVDELIPPELYLVVAEVLAYIYRLRQAG
jgi:flagellar biosynthesis protein